MNFLRFAKKIIAPSARRSSNPTVQAASLHPQGMMAPPTNALIVILSLFAVLSVASAGDSLEATPMVVAKSGDDITLSFTVSNPSILDTVAVRVSWRAGPCPPSHHTLRTREVCKCVHALAHEASCANFAAAIFWR